jgi:predicted alpha/beta hydrolase
MPLQARWRVWLMGNVLGPLLTLWKGYLPWKMLGTGEDLPLDVYRQWRHWCRFPNYFFDDEIGPQVALEFERVRTPIVAANDLDDHWATPRSRDAFMKGYRNASRRGVNITPAQIGLTSTGHMGYFRPQAQPLWRETLHWFESQIRPAQDPLPRGA